MNIYNNNDTITAIATPLGNGGIGIVRISGTCAKALLGRVFVSMSTHFVDFRPWTLHRGHFIDSNGLMVDDVLAVYMPAPRTFTGEEVAEIHCHGGQAVLRVVIETLCEHGARMAEAGEFSRRALLNGRMDLTQAEAIAEMIAAPTREALHLSAAKLDGLLGKKIHTLTQQLEKVRIALCLAVDFPDDEVECLNPQEFATVVDNVRCTVEELLKQYERYRCWQEGINVVLTGAVNAGKSSLLNAFLGYARALVTDIPGTTRDFLEEHVTLHGLSVRMTDTAGLRPRENSDTADHIERMGIERGQERVKNADVVLLVLDGSLGIHAVDIVGKDGLTLARTSKTIVVWNKADIASEVLLPPHWYDIVHDVVCVSAKQGQGLEKLETAIRNIVLGNEEHTEPQAGSIAPNIRQARILEEARQELLFLYADISNVLPYDVCAVRLDAVVALLGQITGQQSSEDILQRVFSTFCIGK